MAVQISQHADSTQLVGTVAQEWLHWIQRRGPEAAPTTVAFGGGRVFRRFLETAAPLLKANRNGLSRLDFFWGDERCVPPDHAESNYRLGWESFLLPLSIGPDRIHRLRGEAEPAEAAGAAEADLRAATRTPAGVMPVIDLIFLGLGEDGHVASLFPGAPSTTTESLAIYLPVIGPKPPPQRLTLSFAAMAAAREVWVIASGAGKETALQASLRSGGNTPLARVLRERATTRVFTDIASQA